MDTPWPSVKLLYSLSEENYDHKFSEYCFWIQLGAAHGGVSNHQLYNDVLSDTSMRPDLITVPWWKAKEEYSYWSECPAPQCMPSGRLIHSNVHLLLRFITDAELDSALSTYAIGLHDRLCRESLEKFFRQSLNYISGATPSDQLRGFYTRVNLIAHWVNLGYVKLEDVRDHILQSLTRQPTDYRLNSLIILLKISGATFAAYVNPSVMDRCCELLKPSNLNGKLVLIELAEVRALVLKARISYECLEL